MTTNLRLRQILLVCVFAAIGLAATANDAFATHFRYGTMTWSINPATPRTVKVRFDAAFRWSYPWGGASVCPGLPFVPTNTTGTGSCPTLGTAVPIGAITWPIAAQLN